MTLEERLQESANQLAKSLEAALSEHHEFIAKRNAMIYACNPHAAQIWPGNKIFIELDNSPIFRLQIYVDMDKSGWTTLALKRQSRLEPSQDQPVSSEPSPCNEEGSLGRREFEPKTPSISPLCSPEIQEEAAQLIRLRNRICADTQATIELLQKSSNETHKTRDIV